MTQSPGIRTLLLAVSVLGALLSARTAKASETPQTSFHLDLPDRWCGVTTILTTTPGPIPCAEGEEITISGNYLPPDPLMKIAIFEGHRVLACKDTAHSR
ncbi:MAG: hypothetical protein ACLQUZ_03760 [Rhizomicrobium sp.]